jgi:hypothetical protein
MVIFGAKPIDPTLYDLNIHGINSMSFVID